MINEKELEELEKELNKFCEKIATDFKSMFFFKVPVEILVNRNEVAADLGIVKFIYSIGFYFEKLCTFIKCGSISDAIIVNKYNKDAINEHITQLRSKEFFEEKMESFFVEILQNIRWGKW